MPEDLAPEFPRERPIGSNNWRIMIFQFIENLYIYRLDMIIDLRQGVLRELLHGFSPYKTH